MLTGAFFKVQITQAKLILFLTSSALFHITSVHPIDGNIKLNLNQNIRLYCTSFCNLKVIFQCDNSSNRQSRLNPASILFLWTTSSTRPWTAWQPPNLQKSILEIWDEFLLNSEKKQLMRCLLVMETNAIIPTEK